MNFKSTLEASGCLGIAREVTIGDQAHVCYTRYSNSDHQWVVGVSDGVEVWCNGFTEEELNDRTGSRLFDNYLYNLSQILNEGGMVFLKSTDVLTLTVPVNGEKEMFKLKHKREATGHEVKTLLLSLVSQLQQTRTKLKVCEKELKKPLAVDQPVYADVTMRSSSTNKQIKRTAGTSLVNPNTKRRKAATGVVFDRDQPKN